MAETKLYLSYYLLLQYLIKKEKERKESTFLLPVQLKHRKLGCSGPQQCITKCREPIVPLILTATFTSGLLT